MTVPSRFASNELNGTGTLRRLFCDPSDKWRAVCVAFQARNFCSTLQKSRHNFTGLLLQSAENSMQQNRLSKRSLGVSII